MRLTRKTTEQKSSKEPVRFDGTQLIWALGSVCVLHQRNFSPDMLAQEFPPETLRSGASKGASSGAFYSESTLLHAAQRLGFRVKRIALTAKDCAALPLPLLAQIRPSGLDQPTQLALITAADAQAVILFCQGSAEPQTLSHAELDEQLNTESGNVAWLFAPEPQSAADGAGTFAAGDAQAANDGSGTATGLAGVTQTFNFRWFVP